MGYGRPSFPCCGTTMTTVLPGAAVEAAKTPGAHPSPRTSRRTRRQLAHCERCTSLKLAQSVTLAAASWSALEAWPVHNQLRSIRLESCRVRRSSGNEPPSQVWHILPPATRQLTGGDKKCHHPSHLLLIGRRGRRQHVPVRFAPLVESKDLTSCW
eukprot:UN2368